MSLESLANELLLDLFEYLNGVHLLRAFHNLNVRFDNLLFIHFQSVGLDFGSVSQHDFNIICQEHLPSIADRLTSLRLSDDDDTPQQIDLFLAHGFTLRQFIHLRSLSLCDLCSEETMHKMMLEWHHLPHLTHLTLAGCSFRCDQTNAQCLIDNIWNLPKLIYCYINMNFEEAHFPIPTVISLSIEQLSIWGARRYWSQTARLFDHTPRLERLSLLVDLDSADEDLRHTVPSITTLNIFVDIVQQDMLTNFFQTLPNLHHLTVEHRMYSVTEDHLLDGYRWEQIIRNYLPKLNVFRFKMEFRFSDAEQSKEQQIDKLLDSFRSRFWLEEHRWFVRCHWYPKNSSSPICLYTLPYAFVDFNINCPMQSKSTCPGEDENDKYWSYKNVQDLNCETCSTEELIPSRIRFPQIHSLSLELPINNQFWSIIPRFDQLTSLNVSLNDDSGTRSQLQTLLDRTPRLYSLTFSWWPSSSTEMSLLELTSISVRRLNLRACRQPFNGEQCVKLSRSSLGIRCEVLSIHVENRQDILELVSNMVKLRALNVQCEDDKWNEQLSTEEDELIDWLRDYLPCTCTINRDILFDTDIRIWIR